jgi:hypothetical protein
MTLGEILYAENEAHERDQINWACSAQNDKLLPKRKAHRQSKKRASEQIKRSVSPHFEAFYAKYGNPRADK